MKNLKLLLLALLIAVFFVSCDDDDEDTPTTVCKILSELYQRDDDTRYSEYVYDATSGVLVRINYSQTSSSDIYSYDVLTYNSSGELIKIENYSQGSTSIEETTNYTSTSGKITKIVETGTEWDNDTQQEVPYTLTANITYSGSEVASIIVTGDRENMGFKNFVYSSGNLSTLDIDFFGNDSVWAGLEAISYDSKNNLEKKLVPDWNNLLFSGKNNMQILVMTDKLIMGNDTLNIGDTLFNRTYTYNVNDEVLVATSHPSKMERETSTNTYTWECIEE